MEIKRRKTRQINVGGVTVGGGAPVRVQSMTNTETADADATIKQVRKLVKAGCELVRIGVTDKASVRALKKIIAVSSVPIIADVHFNPKLAIDSFNAGAAGVRINPGNISEENITQIAREAGKRGVAIRVGVNAGSLQKSLLKKYGHPTPEALAESALGAVRLIATAGCENIKVSVKASSAGATIDSYRLLSQQTDLPLHIGVTEAGPLLSGTVKSSVGLGILLAEGIGDTMRVSLTTDPVQEVMVAKEILSSLGLLAKIEIISCPTCARTETDLIELVEDVEEALAKDFWPPIKVAIMGCVVNGPGEAREADIGVACGKGRGVLFRFGKPVKNVEEDDYFEELMKELVTIKKNWRERI